MSCLEQVCYAHYVPSICIWLQWQYPSAFNILWCILKGRIMHQFYDNITLSNLRLINFTKSISSFNNSTIIHYNWYFINSKHNIKPSITILWQFSIDSTTIHYAPLLWHFSIDSTTIQYSALLWQHQITQHKWSILLSQQHLSFIQQR